MPSSNREVFFKTKEKLQKLKIDTISDSEINHLLIKANRFRTFSELVINFEKPLQNPTYFDRSLKRIINGEPIQYVVESAPFLSYDFYVNKNVLIPRPETEGLCLYIKDIINKDNIKHDIIGDICTGSGCIALYLKASFNESTVYGVDLFEDCLDVANYNKEMYRIDVNFLKGDKFEPFLKNKIRLDVLVSNPPYVENEDDIDPLVKNNEPMTAVYSKDGTAFYEWYFRRHKSFMNKEKFLMAFEINYDQELKLTRLIKKYFRYENVKYKFVKDIYGMTRYLFITKGYENEIIL